jgi:dephospho-CoA kinase
MIVGLTGGIGSGKSTVARLLVTMGYPVYNSDDRAKWLQNNDPDLVNQITRLLGADVYSDGILNRALVASRVFADSDLLKGLNEIVHPAVARDFADWVAAQKSTILFKESAILVETGIYKQCDALVVVTAPEVLRVQRVSKRDGASESEIQKRLKNQKPEAEKIAVADFVIVNDDVSPIIPQVLHMIKHLKPT